MSLLRVNLDTSDNTFDDTNSEPSYVAGNAGNDTIDGGGGSDFLLGGKGEDAMDGGTGRDVLYGGRDNDSLNGGSGRDFLSGDFGADTLKGGSGADTFFFNKRTATEVDTITDYSGAQGDTLLFEGFSLIQVFDVGADAEVYGDFNLIAVLEDVDDISSVTGALGGPNYSDYTPF